MNKEIYLDWIKTSTMCSKMKDIINKDNIKVEDIIKWKKDYDIILEMLSKARYDTLEHIRGATSHL